MSAKQNVTTMTWTDGEPCTLHICSDNVFTDIQFESTNQARDLLSVAMTTLDNMVMDREKPTTVHVVTDTEIRWINSIGK